MNWNYLIAFGIGLGCYFVFLGVFALVKYLIYKRKFEKERKEKEEESNNG